jgi:hypothetical protein
MTVSNKEGLINSGLVSFLIAVIIYFYVTYVQNSISRHYGLGSNSDLSNVLIFVAVIFFVFGIYFWVKAFAIKEN